MIQSQLDPLTDGVGGGADDHDLTIAQIAELFQNCVDLEHWSSVSAVLRILKEQSRGRTALSSEAGCAVLVTLGTSPCIMVAVHYYHVWSFDRSYAVMAFGIWLALAGTFGFHAYLGRAQRKRSAAQRAELRRLALLTLDRIADKAVPPKELDKEQKKAFRTLRSVDRDTWDRVGQYFVGGSL